MGRRGGGGDAGSLREGLLNGLSPRRLGAGYKAHGDPMLEEVTGEKGDRMGATLGLMWVQCFVGLGLGKVGNSHLKPLVFSSNWERDHLLRIMN